jgi:integrating conjugative element protein (TIGR03752 family)
MTKSNPLGKQLVIVIVVLALILLFLKNKSDNNADAESVVNAESTSALSEADTLEGVDVITVESGVEGDTYVDTLSTVTAQLAQLQEEAQKRENEKSLLEQQNQQLQQQVHKANSSTTENHTNLELLMNKISNLETNLENIKTESPDRNARSNGFASNGEYPINNRQGTPKLNTPNLSAPNLSAPKINRTSKAVNYDDEIVWVTPIDAEKTLDDNGQINLNIPDISVGDTLRSTELYQEVADTDYGKSVGMQQGKNNEGAPYITIPRGSTGIDGVALTALIGRIPFGGAVVDPYRFKAIISSENLASNGITIDGLAGAVIGGRATGDYALQCVTGEIDYITFTFEDGSISTFPEQTSEGSSDGNALGYISDNAGVPCITGAFISNGSTYLAQQVGLSGLNAGAQAYAQSATATSVSPEGSTSTVIDANDYALGKAASAGIESASDWLTQRQQSAFDAVYVAPSKRLTVHFEREISINYNPNGRKTNHAQYMQTSEAGYDYTGLN